MDRETLVKAFGSLANAAHAESLLRKRPTAFRRAAARYFEAQAPRHELVEFFCCVFFLGTTFVE